MITAVRRIDFCAGHRVHGHEGKCAQLHGHNYTAYIHAEGIDRAVDGVGRVIDFSVLKERVGGFIEEAWDHKMLLWREDKDAVAAVKSLGDGSHIYLLSRNPTAENIARHLLEAVCPQVLGHADVRVIRVVIWETPNCYAEVTL